MQDIDETISKLAPYLGDIGALTSMAMTGEGKEYIQPALKNLGTVCVPIIREVVGPAVFRGEDPEITDILHDSVRRVRAGANKFKYGERRRGLQVLRLFDAGGRMPQNKTDFEPTAKASSGYDLNTAVFGDSANRGKSVLPVKAGVQYSDAISLAHYDDCVDDTFHNRSGEDGTLFDAVEKKASVNIFSRHFVKPGTLLLQVLTLNGRSMPPHALAHMLACVGLAGAYGGQTSLYGVNVRNHVVGLYGARMERPTASPYEAVRGLGLDAKRARTLTAAQAVALLGPVYAGTHPVGVDAMAAQAVVDALVRLVEDEDPALKARYASAHGKFGEFFDAWFGIPGGGQPKKDKKDAKGKKEVTA